MMKITFLGQAGWLFETDNIKIMIDPYLSDSVEKVNSKNFRRVSVNKEIFFTKPDIMVFTHNHLDHFDPETVSRFIGEDTRITVLAPLSVWNDVRKYGGDNNYVMFNRHTTWTQNGVKFTAFKAEHSDEYAIGVIIEAEARKYYITGDTLYNAEIFKDIPDDIFALFLPINGVGNNMNMTDAKLFAERINAKHTIPMHVGMFDEIKPIGFEVIPEIYKEIRI